MQRSKKEWMYRLAAFAGSETFFRLIVVFFVLQCLWIAFSAGYPMAFDEDFHFGIIRLYAHHFSPFWQGQPDGAQAFGPVYRDPSYMYHFLMSFPYRLISAITGNQTAQVLFLRLINISLLTLALFIFRRLLLRSRASKSTVHYVLLLFVLVPVVPLLGAQINYDNLLIPVVGLILLLTVRYSQSLRQGVSPEPLQLLAILTLCFFASLIKYAFLPVFIALAAYLFVVLVRFFRRNGFTPAGYLAGMRTQPVKTVLLVIALTLSLILCFERYGINVIRFHSPVPACSKALSVDDCSQYGPWARDDYLAKHKTNSPDLNPGNFMGKWLYGMWFRLFFSVDGPRSQFQTRGPLLVPSVAAAVFAASSALLFIRYFPAIWRRFDRSFLVLAAAVSVSYIGVLWLDQYEAYVRTSQPVAINGRYLLPVLLPLLLLSVQAWITFLRNYRPAMQSVALLMVLCLFWGGGVFTFILRSNAGWYWPNPLPRTANQNIQKALGPITPGYHKSTLFLH